MTRYFDIHEVSDTELNHERQIHSRDCAETAIFDLIRPEHYPLLHPFSNRDLAAGAWYSRMAELFEHEGVNLDPLHNSELALALHSLASAAAINSHKAHYDSLTLLGNKGTFKSDLRRQVVRCVKNDAPFALVMFDLVFFKAINEVLTEAVADELLMAIGPLLKANELSGFDRLPSRWGGDEFALLLNFENVAKNELSKVLKTILKRLSEKGSHLISEFLQSKIDRGATTKTELEKAVKKSYGSPKNSAPRIRLAGSTISPQGIVQRHVIVNGRHRRPENIEPTTTNYHLLIGESLDACCDEITEIVARDILLIKKTEETGRL
jgi:diguanylate cyclase (GGDEF)-like protein